MFKFSKYKWAKKLLTKYSRYQNSTLFIASLTIPKNFDHSIKFFNKISLTSKSIYPKIDIEIVCKKIPYFYWKCLFFPTLLHRNIPRIKKELNGLYNNQRSANAADLRRWFVREVAIFLAPSIWAAAEKS